MFRVLFLGVEYLVVVENQVRTVRHENAGRTVRVVDVDAVFDEGIELLEEGGDLCAGWYKNQRGKRLLLT